MIYARTLTRVRVTVEMRDQLLASYMRNVLLTEHKSSRKAFFTRTIRRLERLYPNATHLSCEVIE